jgi:hypothetical protein
VLPFSASSFGKGASAGGGGGVIPPIGNATALDPGDKAAAITLSNSDLTATQNATTATAYVQALHGKQSGKWRFQCTLNTLPGAVIIGVIGPTFAPRGAGPGGSSTDGCGLSTHDGAFAQGNGIAVYDPGDLAASDIVDCYVDLNASPGQVWFAKNGVVLSGDPAAGTGGLSLGTTVKAIYPCVNLFTASSAVTFNFGSSAWAYAGVSGFDPWDDTVPVDYSAWRSIRMYIRSTGFFAHAFAEWEIMASSGGSNILSGATISGSHGFINGAGSNLIDANTTTWNGMQPNGGGDMGPIWIEADLGSSGTRNATHVAIRGRDGGGGGELQAPRLFDNWISADDTIWHKGGTGYALSAFAATTPGERKETTL